MRINTEGFLAGRKLSLTLPVGVVIDATDDGVQVDRDKNQLVGSPRSSNADLAPGLEEESTGEEGVRRLKEGRI